MTQLQKVMKEFNFTFHKMDDNHNDYYEFVLPNCFYIVFIDKKDDKIQYPLQQGKYHHGPHQDRILHLNRISFPSSYSSF
jgi:hypothetical protein